MKKYIFIIFVVFFRHAKKKLQKRIKLPGFEVGKFLYKDEIIKLFLPMLRNDSADVADRYIESGYRYV